MRSILRPAQLLGPLAALCLALPAGAQGKLPSASSTDNDPLLFPEDVTTTTSEGNPDGTRTVTTTDADGNVVDQHTAGEADDPGASLEEVQAEIERQLDEAFGEGDGWDEDFPNDPNEPWPDPDDTPPLTPEEQAIEDMLDTEDQIQDLRNLHDSLLDQAGQTEDPDAFDALVAQAQAVLQQLYDLEDQHDDQMADLANQTAQQGEVIDLNAMADQIEALEAHVDALQDALEQAETDEEAEDLQAELDAAEAALGGLQDEYHEILEGTEVPGSNDPRDPGYRGAGKRPIGKMPSTPPSPEVPKVPAMPRSAPAPH